MPVFTSSAANGLKLTLDKIITDKKVGSVEGTVMAKLFMQKSMSDAWHEDQEYGGPGLLSEKPEGIELASGSIDEGITTRYNARTYGQKMTVSREAIEDVKYDRIIDAGKRLNRAAYKTIEIDATNVYVRAWDSNYVGGDSVSLASASHTLPSGGTWSNTMATPMSPSRASVIIATTAAMQYPGHDGITEGYELKKVTFPVNQWAVWEGLTKSSYAPESDANEINVVERMGLTPVPNKYWTNSTTNYMYHTDCEDGLRWYWRRKLASDSWVDNDVQVVKYGVSYRSARGWSDARCVYGVQA